jgi:putative NADH-flavin reductase
VTQLFNTPEAIAAVLDEIEHPQPRDERFTVVSEA